jgi:hypothetical protein
MDTKIGIICQLTKLSNKFANFSNKKKQEHHKDAPAIILFSLKITFTEDGCNLEPRS